MCYSYRREHPDEHPKTNEGEDWYESDQQRELRQIFSGQSQMFGELRDMGRKLSEIIGRQETFGSLLHQMKNEGKINHHWFIKLVK